ncbi:hypothetical protein RMCBS344292_00318 [Rhizopus microsporus]|nr:hypothetical protein RMCBS344292_00318 [Rhizopus microsporus]
MTLFKRFKRSFSSKATKQPFITRLPEELLVGIYQHLDSPQCRRAFTLTCKSFRRIAQQPSSVAAWMITRFGPRFAIYYAILTIPEQCDHRFLQVIFTAFDHGQNGGYQRQLAVFVINEKLRPLQESLEESKDIGLKPLFDNYYQQENIKMSRKQIWPWIRQWIETNESK